MDRYVVETINEGTRFKTRYNVVDTTKLRSGSRPRARGWLVFGPFDDRATAEHFRNYAEKHGRASERGRKS